MLNNVILNDIFEGFLSTKFDDVFVPEIVSSIFIMLVITILVFVVYFKVKKAEKNPLEPQKGILLVFTWFVEWFEKATVSIMGEKNRNFTGICIGIAMYLFLSFIFGLTGFQSPVTYFGVTLSLALVTFLMIHFTAIKENKWGYFKRFVDPFPVFLPINLLTMWAPLLSLSLRMFGNALSGFCIMSIVYYGLESVSDAIFGSFFVGEYWANTIGQMVSGPNGPAGIFIAPIITPIFHMYFDLFSGFIQTTVFTMLTMIFVLQEQNEEPDQVIEQRISQSIGG